MPTIEQTLDKAFCRSDDILGIWPLMGDGMCEADYHPSTGPVCSRAAIHVRQDKNAHDFAIALQDAESALRTYQRPRGLMR